MRSKRRFLQLDSELANWHPTVSAMAPLVCFVSIWTLVVLLRIITVYGAIVPRCVETDQFWYSSPGLNWPLFGTFFFAFFLLLTWSIVLAISQRRGGPGTRIMHGVNIIAACIAIWTFVGLHKEASYLYHERNGYFDGIIVKPSGWLIRRHSYPDRCELARRIAGRWRVVESEVGTRGFDLPKIWLELDEHFNAKAADTTWQQPYVGTWSPPNLFWQSTDQPWRDGRISVGPYFMYWDFELVGNRLRLTSADNTPGARPSIFVLERIAETKDMTRVAGAEESGFRWTK